jgi:epoxyqueuosine reductase
VYSRADTEWIIGKAKEFGFDLCGVAPAAGLADSVQWKEWLERGYAGQMRYMHDPRRTDPLQVLPDAKSLIVCALSYNTAQPLSTEAHASSSVGEQPRGWISRYAWGDDYHGIVGTKLEQVVKALPEHFGGGFAARAYVDTGPIAERVAARNAGLGWLAKNTCLIHEDLGSWLFLGVVLTSLELAPSTGPARPPVPDLCGNCRLCLDACPTGALVDAYVMDARRCISYLTIELRDSIPEEFRTAMGWQVFGCDICQDVCPWNRGAPVISPAAFQPRDKLVAPDLLWLLSLKEEDFRHVFQASAVRRTKWRGLVRNACIAAGNAARIYGPGTPQNTRLREKITPFAESDDPLLAEHARWALEQLAPSAE